MNNRTHSGISPTVIANPNDFDSSNSTAKKTTTTAKKAPLTNITIDFNALESIPFEDVSTDDTKTDVTINNDNDNDNDNDAHISALLKKLATYFSQSTHKTLNNLKLNNHPASKRSCNLKTQPQQSGDHKLSSKQINIDCAVFENSNAIISVPVSANETECSDDTSTFPSEKTVPCVTAHTTHATTKKKQNHNQKQKQTKLHHSSDRISRRNEISLSTNAMCRADDIYALDGRNTTIATTTMPSVNMQSTKNRTIDLKSKHDATGDTFSLPRVFLRQSRALSTVTNGNNRRNVTNSKTSSQTSTSSLDQSRSYGEQEQVLSSHYSTEKSGSSGYYSSNVYSTSSVEDHIYSEPVIDDISDSSRCRKFDNKIDQQIGLASLEKSIKTLEKHLKCLNKSNKNDQDYVKRKQKKIEESSTKEPNSNEFEQTERLPTIVEGNDNSVIAAMPYRNNENHAQRQCDWNADTTDDSLMDLDFDLDTFLLIDETRNKEKKPNFESICGVGIENPTFQLDNDHEHDSPDSESNDIDTPVSELDDEKEHIENDSDNRKAVTHNNDENTYKCTKYINSCPDDAYNVDEISDYKYDQSNYPFVPNKLFPFYMKNIEDQLNHQSTKEILEEIRNKLIVLIKPISDLESSTESDGIGSSKCNSKTVSLMRNITALKQDVDNYLLLMNQQNELEIRAFCSGLSKNYKLLTMQHALNNRMRRPKLSTSDIGSDVYSNSSYHHHYESFLRRRRRLKNQLKRNQSMRTWKKQSIVLLKQQESDMIRLSSSDSNFQLQKRHSDSICSDWYDGQPIMTTNSSGCSSSSANSIENDDVIIPIDVETLLNTSNHDATFRSTSVSNDASESNTSIESVRITSLPPSNGHIESNLAMQQPSLITVHSTKDVTNDEKDIMLEWHRNKPSIWQQYYGSKRLKYSNMVKKFKGKFDANAPVMTYPSTRPETDFTLDVPRAEQLRIKMQQEKNFRCRCRFMLAFFSLVFFFMTVVIFSLMLSRGKRMFGSMM